MTILTLTIHGESMLCGNRHHAISSLLIPNNGSSAGCGRPMSPRCLEEAKVQSRCLYAERFRHFATARNGKAGDETIRH